MSKVSSLSFGEAVTQLKLLVSQQEVQVTIPVEIGRTIINMVDNITDHSLPFPHIPSKLKFCDFCNKCQHEVARLIEGPRKTNICNECVDIAIEILNEMDVPAKVGG